MLEGKGALVCEQMFIVLCEKGKETIKTLFVFICIIVCMCMHILYKATLRIISIECIQSQIPSRSLDLLPKWAA